MFSVVKHARLLDLLFFQFLFLLFGLGFFVRVCAHMLLHVYAGSKYAYEYNWPACTQAQSMHTNIIGLRTQAYVCACILVPKNPKSEFS